MKFENSILNRKQRILPKFCRNFGILIIIFLIKFVKCLSYQMYSNIFTLQIVYFEEKMQIVYNYVVFRSMTIINYECSISMFFFIGTTFC